jgi:hypothetical protein
VCLSPTVSQWFVNGKFVPHLKELTQTQIWGFWFSIMLRCVSELTDYTRHTAQHHRIPEATTSMLWISQISNINLFSNRALPILLPSQNKLPILTYSCNSQQILGDAPRYHTILPITRELILLCNNCRIPETSVRAAADF